MAFPSVAGTATGTNGTTATTTPVVNLPGSIQAGETLFVIVRVAVAGAIGWPAGWTEIADNATDPSDDQTAAAWRKADGTEGATITLSSASGKFAACAWRISEAADPTVSPPLISSIVTGTSTAPDPPDYAPTGASAEFLWLAIMGCEGEQTNPVTYPTSYTLGQVTADSGTGGAVTTNVRVAGAARQVSAANQNPGAFGISVSDDWTAYTVAFRPAPPAVPAMPWTRRESGLIVPRSLTVGQVGWE